MKKYYRKNIQISSKLEEKAKFYSSLVKSDSYGFLLNELGDSLLFTSLVLASSKKYNILNYSYLFTAESPRGKFFRHPSFLDGSWESEAASSISKDMMMGLAWALWRTTSIITCKDVINYTLKHFFKIGDYKPHTNPNTIDKWVKSLPFFLPLFLKRFLAKHEALSRVILIPINFAKIYSKLSGRFHLLSLFPEPLAKNLTDYQAHLQALQIALNGELNGYITEKEYKILLAHYQRQPLNCLFTSILAIYTGEAHFLDFCETVLLDPKLFPVDRLPTSQDRRSKWLWEHDYNDESQNWTPDLENPPTLFSGGDLIFVISLLKGKGI